MAYGTLKVDNITFDDSGSDQNVTVSGVYRALTSGVSVTGTISGAVIVGGTSVSGTTVAGVTVTGTTIQGASGTFVSLTGTTITGATISGTTISSTTGTFTNLTGTTITGVTVNGITVTATTGNFTNLTGTTTTGTTANFVSGVFTTSVSGVTVTGTTVQGTTVQGVSGTFVSLTGTTITGTTINGTTISSTTGTFTSLTGTTAFVTALEVGDASDTTVSRSAAGVLAVEGVVIPSVSSTNTLTNKTLTDPAIIGTILEDVFTITDGAAFEVDPGNGSIQLITLGANRTPKATNFAAGESITLMVIDGTAYALTWTDATWGAGGVIWTAGGAAPTLATTGYTVLQFWKVSTQVYGAYVGDVA